MLPECREATLETSIGRVTGLEEFAKYCGVWPCRQHCAPWCRACTWLARARWASTVTLVCSIDDKHRSNLWLCAGDGGQCRLLPRRMVRQAKEHVAHDLVIQLAGPLQVFIVGGWWRWAPSFFWSTHQIVCMGSRSKFPHSFDLATDSQLFLTI